MFRESLKRLAILTWGCQMNEHDSERMAGLLRQHGYLLTDQPEEADCVILNTCSVREKAAQKFYSDLGRLKALKARRPGTLIGVAGCLAQQEDRAILKRAPHVDLVLGTSNIPQLPQLLAQAAAQRRGLETRLDYAGTMEAQEALLPQRRKPFQAYVTVQYGCDRCCTFCVIPRLRGREVSRPLDVILREVEGAALQGHREIVLLGQTVNAYGRGQGIRFSELLKEVHAVEGVDRIRFVSPHPAELTDDLIETIRALPKVARHIHLPLQAGSDRILSLMRRDYTLEAFRERVKALREAVPGICVSTDIVVGFPGESEADFQATLKALEAFQFDSLFAFKYSRRPKTKALRLPGGIPEAVKESRLQEVLSLQQGITGQRLRALVGSVQEVLVEGPDRKQASCLTGRTSGNHVATVSVDASVCVKPGAILPVRITRARNHSLEGEPCGAGR